MVGVDRGGRSPLPSHLQSLRQSRRFDPDGAFIRRFLPELGDVSGGAIHDPSALPDPKRSKVGCPDPIVNRKRAVAHARAAFRELRG